MAIKRNGVLRGSSLIHPPGILLRVFPDSIPLLGSLPPGPADGVWYTEPVNNGEENRDRCLARIQALPGASQYEKLTRAWKEMSHDSGHLGKFIKDKIIFPYLDAGPTAPQQVLGGPGWGDWVWVASQPLFIASKDHMGHTFKQGARGYLGIERLRMHSTTLGHGEPRRPRHDPVPVTVDPLAAATESPASATTLGSQVAATITVPTRTACRRRPSSLQEQSPGLVPQAWVKPHHRQAPTEIRLCLQGNTGLVVPGQGLGQGTSGDRTYNHQQRDESPGQVTLCTRALGLLQMGMHQQLVSRSTSRPHQIHHLLKKIRRAALKTILPGDLQKTGCNKNYPDGECAPQSDSVAPGRHRVKLAPRPLPCIAGDEPVLPKSNLKRGVGHDGNENCTVSCHGTCCARMTNLPCRGPFVEHRGVK
ncbi:unnamed protein product [Arctogadus glacialis]